MSSLMQLQKRMNILLIIGMFFSIGLVAMGGVLFLIQHGQDNLYSELEQITTYQTTLKGVWQAVSTFSPLGLIELGLLLLVVIQLLRVGLLTGFYIASHDNWFIGFSVFILLTLIYSFFCLI